MKVTAIINEDLMKSVMELSGGKNRTEGLVIALKDYVYHKKIEQFVEDIHKNPIEFIDGYSAENVRELNRQSRF
jgi:hypothetical protein